MQTDTRNPKRQAIAQLLAALTCSLVACNPSSEDEVRMSAKMDLEAETAAILRATPNSCKLLESRLIAFGHAKSAIIKPLDVWWDGLSVRKRKKLLETAGAKSYAQSMAMMNAGKCISVIKDALKAGHTYEAMTTLLRTDADYSIRAEPTAGSAPTSHEAISELQLAPLPTRGAAEQPVAMPVLRTAPVATMARTAAPAVDRTVCLRRCVERCKDDDNCEARCASSCK
jgi:hypothetical protein